VQRGGFSGGGGGCAGGGAGSAGLGKNGGKGVVIIRSLTDITNSADYSPAVRTIDGSYFIFTFNGSGSIKFS
jgi:hypothetical protein